MQNTVRPLGVACLGLLVAGAWLTHAVGQPGAAPEPTQPALKSDELPPGCLQVVAQPGQPIAAVVYDPRQQVLGVYHVDRTTGEIELKSIRQIQWDLQMLHYQGKKPLPEEIKNDLEALQRR